jgi:hypothetical protein
MILSILLVKPKNDKEKNNDDWVTLSAIKMKWNNKKKWSKSIHSVNKSNNLNGLQSKQGWQDGLWWWLQWQIWLQKQKRTKNLWKKVEVRHTKDGNGSGLFAMEDIGKDYYVIENVGKIE